MLLYPSVTDNRIINGEFLIDQQNAFASSIPAASAFVADKWKFETSGLGSKLTHQVVSTNIAFGSDTTAKCLSTVVTTNATPSAAQYVRNIQAIEGIYCTDMLFGENGAQGIVVSFRARSSRAGDFCAALQNSAQDRSYVFTYNIYEADRWCDISVYVPGDITGTWLSGIGQVGLRLIIDLGSGSNYNVASLNTWTAGTFFTASGAQQLVANSAATLYISHVAVRKGPIVDSQPFFPRPYPVELMLCQREYAKTFPIGTAVAQNAGVAGAITVKNPIALGDPSEWWQFPVSMAKIPTVTTYNPSVANANWRDITAGADATVSVDPSTTVGTNGVLIATSGTVTTLGDILAIHAVADARL